MEWKLITFYKLIRRSARKLIDILTGIFLSLYPESVRDAIENLWKELKVEWSVLRSKKHFRRLRGRKGIKVQLGSGRDIIIGWVNIDLVVNTPTDFNPKEDKDTVLIEYDLRRGLPVEENSCEYIYASHFFEHLEYRYAIRLMNDCYNALRSGGILRIVLPDISRWWEAYLRDDYEYFSEIDILKKLRDIEPGTETLIDFCNFGIYQHGQHKYCYDTKKLSLLLKRAGFNHVQISSFKEEIDYDKPIRINYSLYMDAVK